MIKLSQARALEAQQIGVAKAFFDMGYSPESIKLAFEQQGIYKEAIWGQLASWAGKLAPKAIQYFGGMLGGAAKGMATAPGKTLWQGAKNAFNMRPGTVGGTVGQAGLLSDFFRSAPPRVQPKFYA